MIFARKTFSRFFWGGEGRGQLLPAPVSYAHDYDTTTTKNWRSFFARVEWRQARAMRRSRTRIVVESQCNHGVTSVRLWQREFDLACPKPSNQSLNLIL